MGSKQKLLAVFTLMTLLIVAGFLWLRTPEIPDDPDELTLYSLDPSQVMKELGERVFPKDREVLYDCPVLGQVKITDPEKRRGIIAAIKRDMHDGFPNQAKCFYPRHLLRIVKDGKSVDLVICFQCHNYEVYRDGVIRSRPTPSIGEGSKLLLNQIFVDGGVPLEP
jgi:hypothetical protein